MAIEPINLFEARAAIQPQKRGSTLHVRNSGWKSAKVTRLTGDWSVQLRGPNSILWADGKANRARARELSRNDPYAKKFLKMVRANVVGPDGITLQAKVKNKRGGKLNKEVNDLIEVEFTNWTRPKYCNVNKRMSWCALKQFAAMQWAMDGEVFIQFAIDASSPYGLRLRFIDPDQVDQAYNVLKLPNGNQIVMGIEVDPDFAPVAYWIWETNPSETFSAIRRRLRVPAETIVHCYIQEYVNQVRGIPWMVASMFRMNMLEGYEDAEVTAARGAASMMGFIKSDNGIEYEGQERVNEGGAPDPNGDIAMDFEPGAFNRLQPGQDVVKFDPQHPNSSFSAFVKAVLRGAAAGLGVSYTSLANDLESVNFSSIRAGLLDERDEWKLLQGHFIEHFIQPIFEKWLELSVLSNRINLPGYDLDTVSTSIVWKGRRWTWVDPLKDVQAEVLQINSGLKTMTASLAERGQDFEETIDTIKEEQDYIEAAGVKLGADLKGVADAAPDEETGAEDAAAGSGSGKGKSGN
jgi:lambda family phage portal protein